MSILIDIELHSMVSNAAVPLMTEHEEELAIKLAREYANFLMGRRPKSPACDGLNIMQNKYIRAETWRIVRRHGLIVQQITDWEPYLRERGVFVL